MIIPRTLKKVINQVADSFFVLMLTGPRQVGKTTLLEEFAGGKYNYVTLDRSEDRLLAKNDPALFLQRYSPPLIIDEVQYAPELFSYIKIMVDEKKEPGMFLLTGSQKFHLMRNVTESLAGRVAIIDILGFSQAEIDLRAKYSAPFMPNEEWIESARKFACPKQLNDVYNNIWIGSFPRLWTEYRDYETGDGSGKGKGSGCGAGLGNGYGWDRQELAYNHNVDRDMFYDSYIQTYIQRDVYDLIQVGDKLSFHNFLKSVAARTGQMLNYSDIARDVDISPKTAKSWLSILEASGLVYLLHPYYNNVTKRIIKTPKIYFLDTGLCSYLTGWLSPETLERGAMSGSILETYIFTELLRSYWHNGKRANFYYYRDDDQKEIDLLIEQDGCLHPIEFKKSALIKKDDIKNFSVLKKLDKEVGKGAVICLKEVDTILTDNVYVIPVGYL